MGQQLGTDPVTQPLRVLASFPLPIYITTLFGNFLADALKAAGKDPVVEMCRWNDYLEQQPSIFESEPDYRPTPERPLVYHLFGRLSDPDSLVLTEDDYFDYLIGVTSRNDLIPGVVRRALTDSALLFLGFDLDDWDFRVLFRSIMSREGQQPAHEVRPRRRADRPGRRPHQRAGRRAALSGELLRRCRHQHLLG